MNAIPRHRRIGTKITVIFLVALTPLMAFIAYLNIQIRRDAVEHGRSLMGRAVYEAAAAQEAVVAEVRQMLVTAAELPEMRSMDVAALDGVVTRLQAGADHVNNVFVCDREGEMVASAQKPLKGLNYSHRRYFGQALRLGGFVLGEFVVGQRGGIPVLHGACPIRDDAGRVVGALAVAIDLGWFGEVFAGLDVPDGAFVAFFDCQGLLLARNPPSPALRPGDRFEELFRAPFSWRQASGSFVTNWPAGEETIYAYKIMRAAPDAAEPYGVIVVGMPVAAAMAAARRHMAVSVAVSLGSVVLTLGLAVALSRRAIVDRLRVLAGLAASLREDKVFLLPPRFGHDEIGLLGASLASLSSALHEKSERLAEAMDSLGRERDALAAAVGQLRQVQTELTRRADQDYLTGLRNRRCFTERLRQEFFRLRRYGTPFSLILLDLDDFKKVNDTYGHGVGDDVLRALAGQSLAVLREVDEAYRVGGEEFAVVLPETTDGQALVVAERLRRRVADQETDAGQGVRLRVTVSLGVAQARPDMDGVKALFAAADQALYAAKRAGKDRSVVWTGQNAS